MAPNQIIGGAMPPPLPPPYRAPHALGVTCTWPSWNNRCTRSARFVMRCFIQLRFLSNTWASV